MSHSQQNNSLNKNEDSVPIGSLNIISAKYEVVFIFCIKNE